MKIRYIALFLLPFTLLIACSEEVDQFPDLSKSIPYFMERLHSNRLEVRSYLLDDLKGRDAETKLALETLIHDENNGIAQKALMRYLSSFVDIDKTLFRPELYFRAIVSDRFLAGGIPNEDQYDAFVDNCVRSLHSAKPNGRILQENLTIVGIMGKPGDVEAVYRFLQSPDDNIAYNAAMAVIRLGHREKGCETLRRLASWDSSKKPPYMFHALHALKEMQDPELETIVLDGVASIDRSEGIQPNWVNTFILLAADVTSKDVWNVGEPRNKVEETGQFPDLSKRIPYLMERLHSDRWKVRYCLLGDLKGRDIETKRVLETLMGDENKSVANQATVRYLYSFVDIDKTLFKPELYFYGKVGDGFPEPGLLSEERYDDLAENCIHHLKSVPLDITSIYPILTVVGILGKPSDAEVLYPFLQSTNDYVIFGAAKAVIRLGDKKKGTEALQRLAGKDPSKHLHYVAQALYALKEMQYPELETIVIDVLSSIDRSEGIQLNWLNKFLLLAADVTSKDVWNAKEPKNNAGEVDRFPDLSKRVPYLKERLHSNRWQVRESLLHDLRGRDAETKHVLEMLIHDEDKDIASHALRRYLSSFVYIDKTLFKPELFFYGIVGNDFIGPGWLNEDQYDAFVANSLRRLYSGRLDDHSMDRTLAVVGIMGKPDDAKAVYRFLQGPYDDIALIAAKAVIRLGDREKGMETLRRLASWDSSKDPPYMYSALVALKELQDPELETIVLDALVSIDGSKGNPAQVNTFLLLAADVTSKDVWNVDEPRNRPKVAGQFPNLSKKIPYLMERLYSDRWKVRYCLQSDFKGRDIESKRGLEMLIRDENKSVANQATVVYLYDFVDIDKTLFKPELYFISKPGDEFPEPDLLNEERHDALVEYCLRRLETAQLDDPGMYRILTVVGILGKPSDAKALYPFLQSTNEFVASIAAQAVIRIGDREKGTEALRRLAWDPSKSPPFSTGALYALQEMQDPELERIVNEILVSIDHVQGLYTYVLNGFLLLAADVTGKNIWNVEEPQIDPYGGGGK